MDTHTCLTLKFAAKFSNRVRMVSPTSLDNAPSTFTMASISALLLAVRERGVDTGSIDGPRLPTARGVGVVSYIVTDAGLWYLRGC